MLDGDYYFGANAAIASPKNANVGGKTQSGYEASAFTWDETADVTSTPYNNKGNLMT